MSPRALSALAWFDAGVAPGIRSPGEAPRWERCVDHRQGEVEGFVRAHFSEPHRRALLVGGAGFDPRSLNVARVLASVAGDRITGVFLRERRDSPDPELLRRADVNTAALRELIPSSQILDVQVFSDDRAVAIGRNVIAAIGALNLSPFTDVVLDTSALSTGSSFPVAKLFQEIIEAEHPTINLHVMVTARADTDHRIVPIAGPRIGPVHGFQGGMGLDHLAGAARLWMPQLRSGYSPILDQIHEYLRPDEVVPVLPIKGRNPRAGDRLIEEFKGEIENRWEVDARSIIYADETNPLDFYRTVLRIHDRRDPVFASTSGSLLVLSPLGSKILALGALMAAVERDLPVVHVEALGYHANLADALDGDYDAGDIVHVWLLGEAYPPPRRG